MEEFLSSTTGLWIAVVASGIYHGVNPGMGWPLAVSAPLMERREGALWNAIGALALGHTVAMLVILLPFAAMTLLITWESELRIGAGLLVVGVGCYILWTRRHPRFLARVPPKKLALWSFLVAVAHGAALMLVPIYLGLCAVEELDTGHRAASDLMAGNIGLALLVALAHTVAMTVAGGGMAYAVYKWLGVQFISKSWFDLEIVWALSLILAGGIGLATAL
ncbi:MAG: hypothetical protein AB8B85_10170 [Paracoccaceae bacterium]